MAEVTDRPPDPPAATASLPAAPPAAPDEAPRAYSSLSLLAVAGLAVAAVYGLIVVVGAAVALFNRTPWILPLWSLAAPLAAALVCWAARVRIQNSEGALTGTRLTAAGLWLSLGVGLLYGAYYAACYLSIAQMAAAVGDGWFDDIKNDRIDRAFLLTLPPPRPAADDNLRARLELDYDRGSNGAGPFTDFRQSEIVRQMEQGGAAVQVQCLGVKEWGYTAGGYQVQLAYRVSTPLMVSEMGLTVVGVEGTDDAGGRQWYVKNPQPTLTPELTDEGRRMSARMATAREFAQGWLHKVGDWQWEQAYLDTLPPEERRRQAAERGSKFAEGLKAFREGAFVRAEAPTFWTADPDTGAKISAGVKGLFGRGGESPDRLTMPLKMPTYRQEGGQVRFGFDIAIPLPPQYMVQGRLMVAADATVEPKADDWRVESLDLISGKSAGGSPGGMSRPGGPGMRPMGP